ncbi:hypothetical protein EDD21DRAFT_113164 [Dissophora ornata]|nr:hypothetical protein EDD21DRAFT_113164 [Dissophora ornata]
MLRWSFCKVGKKAEHQLCSDTAVCGAAKEEKNEKTGCNRPSTLAVLSNPSPHLHPHFRSPIFPSFFCAPSAVETFKLINMPVSSGEVGETANGRGTFSESASFAQDPQQHQPQPQPQQQSVTNLSLSQSYPASADNNQLNHHLQAGATSPGVAFSDEHYEQDDSDMEAELDSHPSRETLHEGQILKSGYLYKKGERIKVKHMHIRRCSVIKPLHRFFFRSEGNGWSVRSTSQVP